MKKFIVKIILFFALYLCIRVTIMQFIPYHWGNVWFSSKIQNLEENKVKPEFVFFGSSRVYRQIDPFVFDSLFLSTNNKRIISYNLGAPATFCPQTFYLYENFLNSELSSGCKTVFFELLPVTPIEPKLLHQERSTYWLNFQEYLFTIKSIFYDPNKEINKKWSELSTYSFSYIESALGFAHFRDQLLDWEYYKVQYCGSKKNGFYSLDEEMKQTGSGALADRSKSLTVEGIEEIRQNAIKIKEEFSDKNGNNKYDEYNYQRIRNIIELSRAKGIKIIFFISPRTVSHDILALANNLQDIYIIDLSDPRKYPDFYKYKYSFDRGHLNAQGSKLYTKALFLEYNKFYER